MKSGYTKKGIRYHYPYAGQTAKPHISKCEPPTDWKYPEGKEPRWTVRWEAHTTYCLTMENAFRMAKKGPRRVRL